VTAKAQDREKNRKRRLTMDVGAVDKALPALKSPEKARV
jgi:hypothetical protein